MAPLLSFQNLDNRLYLDGRFFGFGGGSGPSGLSFNYGYQFDGVDEDINFGNVLDLSKNDAFSFSFWIRRISSGAFGIMGKSSTTGSNGVGWSFDTNGAGTNLNFYFQYSQTGNDRYYITTTAPTVGEWQNYTLTYDGSDSSNGFEWYINGVLQTPILRGGSLVNDVSNSGDFRIGKSSLYFGYANMRLDDVQFYNFELNATQVSDIYNNGYVTAPTLGPVHHWKLGEDDTFSTNWTVNDSVGSLNGTSVNMEEEDRKLGVAYSMEFDGVDEYVNFGNILNTEYNEPVSWSFWFRRGATAGGDIIQKATSSNDYRGFNIGMSGSKPRWRLISSASTTNFVRKIGNSAINQGVWNFWVCTYDGSGNLNGLKIYINGVEETYGTSQGVLTDTIINNENLEFSRSTTFGALTPINGDLMYVAQYTSELSASDVTTLYNSGVPVDPRDISLTPSFFAPLGGENDSFSTNWTFVDEVNGNNGTSVNMEETDKTSDTP